MLHFSPIELLIVLAIVLVLFGGGRVAGLGKELGIAIHEFRRGLAGEGDEKAAKEQPDKQP